MNDVEGRHVFLEINPGGKGGSISTILLLEVGRNRALVVGLQENYVLILIPKPWRNTIPWNSPAILRHTTNQQASDQRMDPQSCPPPTPKGA